MSPLTIPERLDQILRHLIGYPKSKGLLACALVRRSWKHPAQSNLYWHVLLAIYPGEPDYNKLDRPCTLLLDSYTHCGILVRSLELYPEGLSSENLTALLNTPPPMLHTLYLALKGGFSASMIWLESAATRCYLDFPHLRRLSLGLHYRYLQTPLFVAAANTIEVLKLDTRHDTGLVDISPYIRIKSLYISCEEDDIWTAASIIESIRPDCTSRIQKLWITGALSDAGMTAIRAHVAEALPALLDVLEVQYFELCEPVRSVPRFHQI
ncbi:hypothetical protein FB45DRAFT_1098351 [Roridomyces roridus]|uniref:F-box domain-containing protein n=1 Tax=Roridomyces roridus TaxID=1738132 RepID=A0AAD7CDN5_9AGAR|nr:hypothetical protein FB45DRAFT_1098351 [Roridomyces roridus]